MSSPAKAQIEQLTEDADSTTVTITVTGDSGPSFKKFMEDLAKICNAGSSRRIAIDDPSDEGERTCHWDFDGDGNTRITVK